MNYQPSFARATGAAFHGPLEDLDRIVQERGAGTPDPETRERGSRSLPFRQPHDRPQRNSGKRGYEAVRAGAEPKREQPRRRIPDRDIIYVGRGPGGAFASEPVDVRDLAYATSTESRGTSAAPTLRQVLVLLLALSIAATGGIYLGKRYAQSHVIIVPATTDGHSVIT